ncbi:DUF4394 domain-containing protein [candidate division KSB1 bacterium]|nr:DUF4394 domain-containing protein [candidate division KSB1 bacterium]
MKLIKFGTKSSLLVTSALILFLLGMILPACQTRMVTLPAVQGRPLYGVDIANNLVRFGSQSPETITNTFAISGLYDGETILGIDFRATDRRLYGLGSSNRIYVIDTLSGGTISMGTTSFFPAIFGTSFGFDFNPVPDRIRLHSNAKQDLRLDPDTGVVSNRDSTLAYAAPDINAAFNAYIVGTAYTNSVVAARSTTLYAIDSNLGILVILPSPNNGQLYTVGPLGVVISDFVGFDIAGKDSTAYAALTVAGNRGSGLYTIDLFSGAATYIGDIGGGILLRGLAIRP